MKDKMDKEIRNISYAVECRLNTESNERIISGYAVRFNEQSADLGFYETIKQGAITQDVIDSSDILMLYNHDASNFLARSREGKGSLKLELREDGLYFEFVVPDTDFGKDILSKIERGDLTECSFCFTLSPEKDADEWKNEDGTYYRTINKIGKLYDVSIVNVAAYPTTSVNSRSFDEVKEVTGKLDGLLSEVDELVTNITTILE